MPATMMQPQPLKLFERRDLSLRCRFANDIEYRTVEWYVFRRGGVVGSDIATILNVSPYEGATPRNLAAQKLGLLPEPEVDSFALRRAHWMEPDARILYAHHAHLVEPGQEHRLLAPLCAVSVGRADERAVLDGLVMPDQAGDARNLRPRLLNIHCPNHRIHRLIGAVSYGDRPMVDLPVHYQTQMQWNLYITGFASGDLVSYSIKKGEESPLHLLNVLAEPGFVALVLPTVRAFADKVLACRGMMARLSTTGDTDKDELDRLHLFNSYFPPEV